MKITKRFPCANEKRTQQTGALLTELTRRWSNLGSGSHGQLFRPYWGSSTWHSRQSMNEENQCIKDPLARPPTPPLTFRKAPPPLLFRHITESSFFMVTNRIPWLQFAFCWNWGQVRISVFVLVWARYVPVGCRKINCIESEYKKNNQTNETHCTFLLKLRPVAHIVMYNLKASLYVTVCLPGFLTKIDGELKSWADFVFISSVNRKYTRQTNRFSSPRKNVMFPRRTTFQRNCRIWRECQCQCPTL